MSKPHVAALIKSYHRKLSPVAYIYTTSLVTLRGLSLNPTSFPDNTHSPINMADRQVTQQTIFTLLSKLNDPDADLRYMSLNDLYGILTNPNSSFLSHDRGTSTNLAEGLLKALDDQHGDVQNQALKWFVLSASPL